MVINYHDTCNGCGNVIFLFHDACFVRRQLVLTLQTTLYEHCMSVACNNERLKKLKCDQRLIVIEDVQVQNLLLNMANPLTTAVLWKLV